MLVFGIAGAKASLLPLLIVGLLAVLIGVAITGRRLHVGAALGLAASAIGLILATVLLFRGSSGGLQIGLGGLQSGPVAQSVGARRAHGLASVVPALVAVPIAVVLWSFLWAAIYGLLLHWRKSLIDPAILLLIGISAAGLGATVLFLYPGLSEVYYLRGAAGAFGLLTAAGLAAIIPHTRGRSLVIASSLIAIVGLVSVLLIRAAGPQRAPILGHDRLSGVVLAMISQWWPSSPSLPQCSLRLPFRSTGSISSRRHSRASGRAGHGLRTSSKSRPPWPRRSPLRRLLGSPSPATASQPRNGCATTAIRTI